MCTSVRLYHSTFVLATVFGMVVLVSAWLVSLMEAQADWKDKPILEKMRKDLRYQASTSEQTERGLDRMNDAFQLFTNCQSLAVTVTISKTPKTGNMIEFTEDDVQNSAESRLRGAHIYGSKFNFPSLDILIGIYWNFFSMSLELRKTLADTHSQIHGGAITWADSYLGVFSDRGGYILSNLSRALDHFIADYLRVNEQACVANSQ